MSKWDKLLLKITNLSKTIRFEELKKILESYGYHMNMPRGGSSHYTFRKEGKILLQYLNIILSKKYMLRW